MAIAATVPNEPTDPERAGMFGRGYRGYGGDLYGRASYLGASYLGGARPPSRKVCTYVGHRSHVLCCTFFYWLYTGTTQTMAHDL